MDIVASIKETASRIGREQGDELRWKVRQALEKAKPPKANTTKEEQAAIKSLKQDDSIIILPADKGNTTVVMNKEEYTHRMNSLVTEGAYKKLERDPTPASERKLTKLIKKNKDNGHLTDTQYRKLNQHHSKLPHMYGLPKVQKTNVPLRPIVSCRDSACHPLSQFLVKIINPLSGKTPTYVKNSAHFVSLV